MTDPLKTPLWDFALAFYGRPGVSEACLALQDEAGVDVIHLIALAYADCRLGRPLGAADIARLGEAMADWRREAVLPLRAVRRSLKAPLPQFDAEKEALRTAVKAAELKAEQLQLAIAERWLSEYQGHEGLALPAALTALLDIARDGDNRSPAKIDAALALVTAAAEATGQHLSSRTIDAIDDGVIASRKPADPD